MLVRLEWDSEHFGLPVARIEPAGLPEEELRADLERAREEGVRLVYAFGPENQPPAEALLAEFGGRAVSTQVEYRRELPRTVGPPAPEGVRIEGWGGAPAPPDLRALAVEAGRFSRFRVDPGISRDRFEALYVLWLERSIRRELADHVLVARDESRTALGLVTVARPDPARGRIGLLSVDPRWRRFGIATALMAAAEERMREAGCREAEVVTQAENAEVCRFYATTGYAVAHRERAYHFRPAAEADA